MLFTGGVQGCPGRGCPGVPVRVCRSVDIIVVVVVVVGRSETVLRYQVDIL